MSATHFLNAFGDLQVDIGQMQQTSRLSNEIGLFHPFSAIDQVQHLDREFLLRSALTQGLIALKNWLTSVCWTATPSWSNILKTTLGTCADMYILFLKTVGGRSKWSTCWGPLPALHVHEGRSGSTPYLSFLGGAGGQVVVSHQRVGSWVWGSWVCTYEKDSDKNYHELIWID